MANRARDAVEHELVAAIYERPADDEPRLVYADYLTERGDPRGELIVLQLQPALDARQRVRIATLLTAHRRAWLGPLADLIDPRTCVFERGFLAVCRIDLAKLHAVRAQVVGHPAWSTVRLLGLDQKDWNAAIPDDLVFHPAMKALVGLSDLNVRSMDSLLRRDPLPFVYVDCAGHPGLWTTANAPSASAAVDARWADSTALPALRELSLAISYEHARARPATSLRWLWTAALGRSLERLDLRLFRLDAHGAVAPWLDEIARHAPPSIRVVELRDYDPLDPDRQWLRFTRDATGWALDARIDARDGVRVGLGLAQVTRALDELAGGALTSVRVVGLHGAASPPAVVALARVVERVATGAVTLAL